MDALFDPVLSAGLCGEGAAGRTYDTATQSFGVGGEAPGELAKNYYAYDDDDDDDGGDQKRQVRHVTDKMLAAAAPLGMLTTQKTTQKGGASEQHQVQQHQTRHDTFTGLIDVITGQPLHGTRYYALTGEIYEGPFHPNPHPQNAGKRHGRDAVVQNLWLPDEHGGGLVPLGIGLVQNRGTKRNDNNDDDTDTDTTGRSSSVSVRQSQSHKFFGTYHNDQPHHGTLITHGPSRKEIYHGPLRNYRPHTDRPRDQIPTGNVPYNALEEANHKFRSGSGGIELLVASSSPDGAQAKVKEASEAEDRSTGTLARPDGYRYEGDFKMGHPEGKGVEVGSLTTFDLEGRWGNDNAIEEDGSAECGDDDNDDDVCAPAESSNNQTTEKGRGVYRGQYMGGLHHGIGTYSFYVDAEPGKDYNPNRFVRGSNTVDSTDNLLDGFDENGKGEQTGNDAEEVEEDAEDVVIQDEDDFMYSKTYCEEKSNGESADDGDIDTGSETSQNAQPVPETPAATPALVPSERQVDSHDDDDSSTDSARAVKPTEDPFSPSQGGLTASQLAASIDAALLSESSDESDSDDHDPRPWAKVRQDREAAEDPILSQLKSDMQKAELEVTVAYSVSAALSDVAARDNAEKEKLSRRPKRRRKRVLYSYSGQWYASQRHGEGTERMPSGEIYEGDFVRDQRDGYGCLSFWTRRTTDIPSSIRSVAGRWSQGKSVDGSMSGWTVAYLDGSKYTGYLDIDGPFAPHGYGVKRYANGDVFCGCWADGKRNGEGVFVHKDPKEGGETVGIWKDDELAHTGGEIASGESMKRADSFVDVTKRVCEKGAAGMDVIDLGGKNLAGPTIGTDLTKAQQDLQRTMVKDVMKKALGKDDARSEAEHDSARTIRTSSKGTTGADTETVYFFDQKEEKKEQLPILQSYPNGDTYLGNLDHEKRRQGYGVYLSSSTGSTYSGNFRSDKRHGYGILYHPKFGKYCGDFVDDMKWGQGSLILNDASTYIGGFVNNLFHGKGTLCERDGRTYVGHWKGGKRDGEGIEIYMNGQVFFGEHKDGLRHCELGTMLERSGGKVIYSGGFSKGLYHGEGKLIQRLFADPADMAAGGANPRSHGNDRGEEHGKVVEYGGSFVGGQLYGYGVLRSEADGVTYKGEWDKNRPSGKKWRIEYHDGSIYSGTAKHFGSQPSTAHTYSLSTGLPSGATEEDETVTLLSIHQEAGGLKPDGFGTMKYASGDVYVGTFEAGKREEEGQCVFANGDKWEGQWLGDRPNMDGTGTLTLADGTVQRYVSKS